MSQYISVIDEPLDGRKRGLRLKVRGIEVDDNGYITQMKVEWTTLKSHGLGWVRVEEGQAQLKGAWGKE